MIEEILPNLYTIEVPLPQNPLKAVHSYVIKAQGQSLIIDTGMNREECMNVMSSGLRELDVDLKRADFFITHMHADHIGLVSNLATDTSRVYFSQADAAIVINSVNANFWERMADFARFVVAAEPALPWNNGLFLKAYENNRAELIDIALDADPAGTFVLEFMDKREEWSGTHSELLESLKNIVPKSIQRIKGI